MSEKILVIDDHFETLRLTSLILKRKAYTVLTAQSGANGLELAKQNKPDLVLLDIMMPEMDGIEVCRHLRADPTFNDMPIMMFTARSHESDRDRAIEAGASGYIVKPTRPKELLEKVQEILARPLSDSAPAKPTTPMQTVAVGLLSARAGLNTHRMATYLAHALAQRDLPTTFVELLGRPAMQPQPTPNGFRKQARFELEAIEADGALVVDLGHRITPDVKAVLPHLSHVVVCVSADLMAMLDAQSHFTKLTSYVSQQAQLHALVLQSTESEPINRTKMAQLLHRPVLDVIASDPNLVQYHQLAASLLAVSRN